MDPERVDDGDTEGRRGDWDKSNDDGIKMQSGRVVDSTASDKNGDVIERGRMMIGSGQRAEGW